MALKVNGIGAQASQQKLPNPDPLLLKKISETMRKRPLKKTVALWEDWEMSSKQTPLQHWSERCNGARGWGLRLRVPCIKPHNGVIQTAPVLL